jgi:hypothetical protein
MRVALAAATACILAASALQAADIEVKNPMPSTYTVVKGDTLWGIASRFLKDPWRWPDIWRMNREAIKNPHRIYPGDVIALERGADGQWQLQVQRSAVRVSPTVRVESLDAESIPSIPPGDLEPFLSRPLITGRDGLVNSGEIVAGRDARVVRGNNDVVYAIGLDPKAGDRLHIYRPGRTLTALDTGEVLGYEQRYIGSAHVERFADVSTVRLSITKEEVLLGDRLVPTPPEQIVNFAPHAPDKPVDAQIIANGRDSVEVSSGWIVTIDKGSKDGIDVGTVLAVYRVVPPIPDPKPTKVPDWIDYVQNATRFFQADPGVLQVPDERSGLMFVFRVFDRVSYALIVNATDPILVGDRARKP